MPGRIRHTGGVGSIATAKGGAVGDAPDFIAATTAQIGTSNSNPIVATKPDGAGAGDILLVSIMGASSRHMPPDRWKRLAGYYGGQSEHEIFALPLDGTEGATFSFAALASSPRVLICAAYRPKKGYELYLSQMPVPRLEDNGASGSTIQTVSLTPKRNSKFIFFVGAPTGSLTIPTPPSGCTQRATGNVSSWRQYLFDCPAPKGVAISKSGVWSVADSNRINAALLL